MVEQGRKTTREKDNEGERHCTARSDHGWRAPNQVASYGVKERERESSGMYKTLCIELVGFSLLNQA